MTPHLHRHIPHSCQITLATVRQFPNRKKFLIPLAGLVVALALSSCNDDEATERAPTVTVTDTQPVGDGLTVLGFAIVGAAVVIVLGRLLR